MQQQERNQTILRKYIPEAAVELMAHWIVQFDFKLKIKRSRQSKYGDYRPPLPGRNHQITINHDLNAYGFLLTLVHEVAHLLTFERHGHRVKPHGEEWKTAFKDLMRPVMQLHVFPDDVRDAIVRYMQNPAATSCSDLHLMRVLRRYDDQDQAQLHLEQLPLDAVFSYGGRRFRKGIKRRTRFLCVELQSNRQYLFSPLAEVESETPVELPEPVRMVAHSIPPPVLPALPPPPLAVPELAPVVAVPELPPVAAAHLHATDERVPLAALPEGSFFELAGTFYQKGPAEHTHYRCTVANTQTIARFSPAVLVHRVA